MRKTVPSTYDSHLTSDDIREFKRLLRLTPGASQNIFAAQRIDEIRAEVRTGGPIGGRLIEFLLVDGEWELKFAGTWII